MFIGKVQQVLPIFDVSEDRNFRVHTFEFDPILMEDLAVGSNVSHNGCALIVSHIEGNKVSFDLSKDILRLTQLGFLSKGDQVNIERPIRLGEELSNCLLNGQIDCIAEVHKIYTSENNRQIWFKLLNSEFSRYLIEHNFISVDGLALTISEVKRDRFSVYLVPTQIKNSTLGNKKLGSRVNIEFDRQTKIIVNTTERIVRERVIEYSANIES